MVAGDASSQSFERIMCGPRKCAHTNCNRSTVLLISCHIKNFSTFISPHNHPQASRSFNVAVQDSSLVMCTGLHRFCDRPLSQMSVSFPLHCVGPISAAGQFMVDVVGRSDNGAVHFLPLPVTIPSVHHLH